MCPQLNVMFQQMFVCLLQTSTRSAGLHAFNIAFEMVDLLSCLQPPLLRLVKWKLPSSIRNAALSEIISLDVEPLTPDQVPTNCTLLRNACVDQQVRVHLKTSCDGAWCTVQMAAYDDCMQVENLPLSFWYIVLVASQSRDC